MTDETEVPVIGGNAEADLLGKIDRINAAFDAIATQQEIIKEIKAEAANDGYDVKELMIVVKETRQDMKKHAAKLRSEQMLRRYREVAQLPTDLEVANRLAQQEADTLPSERKSRRAANDPL